MLTVGGVLLLSGCSFFVPGERRASTGERAVEPDSKADPVGPFAGDIDSELPSVVGAWADTTRRGWVLILRRDGTYVNAHDSNDSPTVYRGSYTFDGTTLQLRRESPTTESLPVMTLRKPDNGPEELVGADGVVRWRLIRGLDQPGTD